MVQSCFDGSKLLDQFNRTLVADAWRSGDIVNTVATQRHDVYHALGRDTKNLLDFCRVADQVVFRRVKHQNAIINELQHVLIAGDDVHQIGLHCSFLRQRANNVVGLIASELENRNSIGFERAANIGKLLCQVTGHLAAICFVASVFNLLEGLSLQIESAHTRDFACLPIAVMGLVLWGEVIAQLAKHVDENVCRCRGQPGFRRHTSLPRHGMVGAEDE